ncbi:Cysteine-rich receptor-like protein kinase 25 [Carex littledalei]|uniref:non-specific serine/threonine protein kinase n=1 Tax=Carex littledalei TaxID=544730 RepID=A0A833QL66_9POAL|nr:Cysteine-rich receptor-like protein kinase 25 [Carex littledalei]
MVLWRLILLLISAVTIPVHSQLDSQGFLSIDCGTPPNFTYVDTLTNLSYVSDEQFIDTGVNIQIPPSNGLPRAFETVRSFPTGIRNCYTLRSLTAGLKYPEDKYDRWWFTETLNGTTEISTNSTVQTDDDFEIPSIVKQTAATTNTTEQPLNLNWITDEKSTKYYLILHFYEIQTSLTSPREFDILINGNKPFNKPSILQTWNWSTILLSTFTIYNVSLVATSSSTLPPLLNGYELYKIAPVGVPTYGADVAAINSMKQAHQIRKGWSGDPCLPIVFIWTCVSCTSNSNITRITALNLSSSGLTGPLSLYFANLSALVSLDLSSNNLSGSLPSSLDQLTVLTYLDIRGNNNISTILPLGLQQKQQNGTLTYRFDDINPFPSPSTSPSSRKYIIIKISIAVVVVLLIVVVIAAVFLLRRKLHLPENVDTNVMLILNPSAQYKVFDLDTLRNATHNFSEKNKLGQGGFGPVYKGTLPNGQQLAVKRLSGSSLQGLREMTNEVEFLAKLKHKNLVELLGCCIEKKENILCYEFLPNGSLDKILFAKDPLKRLELGWKMRYKIIEGIGRGLHYLHEESRLKIIHRDLKSSNILLDKDMSPKISDFGLARFFAEDQTQKETTVIAGTFGYMAPEYVLHGNFSAKSDVYSFGVLLLEIVTGQRNGSCASSGRATYLVSYAWQHWKNKTMEELKDPMIEDLYLDEVTKCVHIALLCVQEEQSIRPNMEAVNRMLAGGTILNLPSTRRLPFIDISMSEESSIAMGSSLSEQSSDTKTTGISLD